MDSLEKQLKKLGDKMQKAADDISGEVSFEVLFNNNFMARYTKCASFDQFCEQGGVPTDIEGFKAFPDEDMDKVVIELTQFDSWEDMQETAATLYTKEQFKKQGFDVR